MTDFSVLLSVYQKDSAPYLEECLESVFCQSLQPTELILIKDGPLGEQLDSVIERWNTRYPVIMKIVVLEQNVGLGNALKIGVEHCRFELVARMDADDVCAKDRFLLQITEFEKNPALSILGGQAMEFDRSITDGKYIRRMPLRDAEIRKFARKRNPFNHMTVMFRRSAVLAAGNYIDMRFAEDYYLWIRMLYLGKKAANMPDVLVYARVGEGMMERRGGWQYVRYMMNLQREIYKTGYITLPRLVLNACIRGCVGIAPLFLRQYLYKNLLRKRSGGSLND